MEVNQFLAGNFKEESVDYSKWQRRGKRIKSVKKKNNTLTQYMECDIFTVQQSVSSPDSVKKVSRKCYKPELTPRDTEKENRLLDLRTKILERERQIKICKTKMDNIELDNTSLRNSIDESEGTTHAKVNHQLRRYEQFRGGILVMNNEFTKEKIEVENELAEITEKEQRTLKELEEQVAVVSEELNIQQKHLQLLMNYKDTEYPMKFLQKTELEHDIIRLQRYNESDEMELKRVVTVEVDKFRESQYNQMEQVVSNQRNQVSQKIHPSLLFMDKHNTVMRKEVQIHNEKIDELNKNINELKEELKYLQKTNSIKDIRKIMFPDIFIESDEKCRPDMEITLDITRKKCLPI